jgi:hypothetical protein
MRSPTGDIRGPFTVTNYVAMPQPNRCGSHLRMPRVI